MAKWISREKERTGTRNVMLWGAAAAVVLAIAITAWPLLPGRELGTPEVSQSESTGIRSNQGSGSSATGKTQPGRPEDASGGKARDIQETAQPVKLSEQQRRQVSEAFTGEDVNRTDEVDFTLSIGSAVPRDVDLKDLPAKVSSIMGGYEGARYVMVRDQLVIVDAKSRRVVALVPGIG